MEKVDTNNAQGLYQRLAPGTPHPNQEKYPGYLFLTQKTLSEQFVQRYWSTPAFYVQDVYNWEKDFVSDSVDHPIFVRRYKIRRDQYDDLDRESTLSGVWIIKLTNAGSGYDPDSPPAVNIAGTGTGAVAEAFVSPDTSLSWIRLTAEGTGYTAPPTITISDPPVAGVTATATATIQATSCKLIKQTTNNFAEDDPRFALFLIETRVYQTFPGPILDRWDFEPRINRYIKVQKQLILKSTVPADPNASVLDDNVTVEYQDLTAVYSAKITSTVPTDLLWENGGADFTYEATVNHRFPDQITENPIIYGSVLYNTTTYASDYGWDIRVEEGYAGPCRAVITERYTADPTDAAFIAALPAPTAVFPEAQLVFLREYGFTGSADSQRAFAKVTNFAVPLTLHPQLTIQTDLAPIASPSGFTYSDPIPATTPTGFTAGDTYVVVNEPQRVGVGKVWLYRIVTLYHP